MSAPTGPLPRSHSTSTLGRRQACDRCSEQKVRCIRNTPTSDDVVGDGEAVGSARCLRCRKARASCVYSFYQRTGRPSKRSSSDLQWENHSKRPTRTSTPVPVEKTSASSSTIEVLAAAATTTMRKEPESRSTPVVETELDHHDRGHNMDRMDHNLDHNLEQQNCNLPDTNYDTTYEQCMAEFGLNGLEIWTGMPSLSTGSISPQVELELGQMNYPIPGVSGTCIMASDPPEYTSNNEDFHRAEYETGNTNNTNGIITNTTTTTTTNSSSGTPNSTEAYIEQLADLNLAIFRSTRSLCQCTPAATSGTNTPTLGTSNTPVSLAWPFSGEIFEATSSLIKLIDSFTQQQQQQQQQQQATADVDATLGGLNDPMVLDFETSLSLDQSPEDPNASVFAAAVAASASAPVSASAAPAAVKSAPSQIPDPGVALLILAAHQRLLSAFENMCSTIHRYLQEGQGLGFSGQQVQQQQSSGCLYGGQNQMFMPPSSSSSSSHSHSHSLTHSHSHAHSLALSLSSPADSCNNSPFGSPAPTFAPSSTAQFVVVVELITYYLNRLDRALGPAVSGEPDQGPDTQSHTLLLVQPLDGFDLSSGSSDESSPDFCTLGLAETYSASSHTQSSKASDEGTSSSSRALMKVGHEMQDRYQKLREHIRVIKRVIRASNDS